MADSIFDPKAPAIGWFAFQDAVELVEGSANHANCKRADGIENLMLEVVGVDGIPTYHETTGLKAGCVFRILDADDRVHSFLLRSVNSAVLKGARRG